MTPLVGSVDFAFQAKVGELVGNVDLVLKATVGEYYKTRHYSLA